MTAYIVATVEILDQERFAVYGKAIAGLSESFGGEPIVRGAVLEYLEGEGPANQRVVVTRFPDAAAARAYIGSATYQTAKAHRHGAATVTMRLLEA